MKLLYFPLKFDRKYLLRNKGVYYHYLPQILSTSIELTGATCSFPKCFVVQASIDNVLLLISQRRKSRGDCWPSSLSSNSLIMVVMSNILTKWVIHGLDLQK